MSGDGRDLIFCDGHVLVRAEDLAPVGGAGALAELEKTRKAKETFTVRPQGFSATEVEGSADAAPEGCAWVRVRELMAAESTRTASSTRR